MSMEGEYKAFATRTGRVGFLSAGLPTPPDCVVICEAPYKRLHDAVNLAAQHVGGGCLQVPGIDHASGDGDIVDALVRFITAVESYL